MLGISELDSDMRVLEKAIEEGNEKAALAVEAAAYRIKSISVRLRRRSAEWTR